MLTQRLIYAAYKGDKSIVCSLLDEGIDIMSQSSHGNSALHTASRNGKESMVSLLIERGADVNILNHVRRFVIHLLFYPH